MQKEVLRILTPGLGATIQDRGRPGWRSFGVPPGGAMDGHAAGWANRLLENPLDAPVIEFLLQGARLIVLQDAWFALTGAEQGVTAPTWRSLHLRSGERIDFPRSQTGVWSYLAVEGGFFAPRILGSASVNVRAGLGSALRAGEVLAAAEHHEFHLPAGVAGRVAPVTDRRNYAMPPGLNVWRGPQAALFSAQDWARLFEQPWRVSSQSDRVGYRLEGPPLESRLPQMLSEPLRVGTLQVAGNGQPIVTMRDGPTVGGYPKLGLLESDAVSWLAQCRPGQEIRFRPAHET
jgi:biotin-dependent carboxylase-like uncharacterized protein